MCDIQEQRIQQVPEVHKRNEEYLFHGSLYRLKEEQHTTYG